MHTQFLGELEDMYNWLMTCPACSESRVKLIAKVNHLLDVPDHIYIPEGRLWIS